MRGLDVRIELAHARVAAVVAGEDGGFDIAMKFIDAFNSARLLGFEDAGEGRAEPPLMFRDEPDLLSWWNDGYNTFIDMAEVEHCSYCNDHTVNTCLYHG
ncbi:hypothetical protein AB595_10560 [Massilia sp. WF1]|jgi:hypothetical protein|uniref:hypothetical protein n=1 Tax=unclassified Massilia TaxID=2609279 RepID=UPI00064A60B4|nr:MULTISPECIES: hypothetical protein [unclassified Massilia]ALK99910.1 hypothetical protein AM586_26970 [Massilia sp. WG5]KLU36846.1 hypothetical protein AB595_10560 [Massilia sp. WF1]